MAKSDELAKQVQQFSRRSSQPRVKITKKTRPQAKSPSKPVTLKTVAQKTQFPTRPIVQTGKTTEKGVRFFTKKSEIAQAKKEKKNSAAQQFNRSEVKGTGKPDFVKDFERGGGRGQKPIKDGVRGGIPKPVKDPNRSKLVKKTKVQQFKSEFRQNKKKKLLTRTSQRTSSIRKRKPKVNDDFIQDNKSQQEINQIFDFNDNGRGFF